MQKKIKNTSDEEILSSSKCYVLILFILWPVFLVHLCVYVSKFVFTLGGGATRITIQNFINARITMERHVQVK